MSKMNDLDLALNELRTIGEKLTTIADTLKECFSANAPAEPEPEAPKLSFIDVRHVLTEKSRAGHTAKIKELLSKYGVEKLSDLAPENYAAIVAEAEVL